MDSVINNIQNQTLTNMFANVVEFTKQTGARFASLTYTNEAGETSRYNIILGVSIEKLYKQDLATLKTLRKSLKDVALVACDELIASIKESLEKGIGNNSRYTLQGYYSNITPNGEVKLHKDEATGETNLYIRGYVKDKVLLSKAAFYKHVNSSAKTLAKKALEKNLKRGKIRTFKINVNVLQSVRMNGLNIEIN